MYLYTSKIILSILTIASLSFSTLQSLEHSHAEKTNKTVLVAHEHETHCQSAESDCDGIHNFQRLNFYAESVEIKFNDINAHCNQDNSVVLFAELILNNLGARGPPN